MKNREVNQSDYYDQKLLPLDDQLCELLKQRKELSNNNPGVPPIESSPIGRKSMEFMRIC